MKKYVIFCSVRDGAESKPFEFEYETDKDLRLETLSADDAVMEAAFRSCPTALAAGDLTVKGLTFDRVRHFTVRPADLRDC